jgi:hypothetical protein
MSNPERSKKKTAKLNEILIFIAIETDLRPSEMRQLVYVDADVILNKITVLHPPTHKTFEIQCDSSHGWMVDFLATEWDHKIDDPWAD